MIFKPHGKIIQKPDGGLIVPWIDVDGDDDCQPFEETSGHNCSIQIIGAPNGGAAVVLGSNMVENDPNLGLYASQQFVPLTDRFGAILRFMTVPHLEAILQDVSKLKPSVVGGNAHTSFSFYLYLYSRDRYGE